MKINKELAAKARKLDICKPWLQMLKEAKDKHSLMKMFVKGIDFCLANNFPSVEYLEKHGQEVTDEYGVHVNKTVKKTDSPFTVLLGESKAELTNNGFSFSQIFIKHDSIVDITATGNSLTIVDVFDDSVLIGTVSDSATMVIYKYGNPRVDILKSGNATLKIIDKQRKTY
ncbi:hypothetical protein [Albibacterium profundi]|uniref:Uncharacterized protein n=1 Tax=Albibacterium profundi TaxID=3134906 RepID=A0ABV5CF03_9SPHI